MHEKEHVALDILEFKLQVLFLGELLNYITRPYSRSYLETVYIYLLPLSYQKTQNNG